MRISLFACLLVGCGSSHDAVFDSANENPDGSSGFTLNPEGGIKGSDAASTTGGNCTAASKLIYLITAQNELWSFDPTSLALMKINALDCPVPDPSVTPNSMAVDRNAKAYVNMNDGSLYTVDTSNAHCSATTYELDQEGRTIRGMGFSSNTTGSTDETLFTCTALGTTGGGGLASIDVNTFTLTPIGDYSNGLAGGQCELTGTGDARLFGFFALSNPTKLAAITKTTAATPSPISLSGVPTTLAYAFSFWGGDFWFYTSDSTGTANSKITHYKYATDKSYTTAVADTKMIIVGAGVSTCAPIAPPN